MLGVFGSVVSRLDERSQTRLPGCESSSITTVTDPVWGGSVHTQQELGFGLTVQPLFLLFFKHPSVLFWLYAFTKYYLASEEEIIVCLVVNDKRNAAPLQDILNPTSCRGRLMSNNDHVWWCSVCTYIFLTVINRYIFTNVSCATLLNFTFTLTHI